MIDMTDSQESLDTIFAGVLIGGLKNDTSDELKRHKALELSYCYPAFKARFRENIFYNKYALFYIIFKELNAKVFTVTQLRQIIRNNFDDISDSPFIDLSEFKQLNPNGGRLSKDEVMEVFIEDCEEEFVRLSNLERTRDQFDSCCSMYIRDFKEKYMFETAQTMANIMSPGGVEVKLTRRRKQLFKGSEDSKRYYRQRLDVLNSLDEDGGSQHILLDEKYLEQQRKSKKAGKTKSIMDYGITEIDNVKSKMRRGNLVEVVGAPKGGKTTFLVYLVERALSLGYNVAIWCPDGENEEMENLVLTLMVRHFKEGSMVVDKTELFDDSYETEEHRQAIESARQMLVSDPTRGRLSFIEAAPYLETMEETIMDHFDNCNPFDVIAIDSLVNFQSMNKLSKVETISKAYMTARILFGKKMKTKPLCLLTAQLKQEVVDLLRKNPDADIDVTGGGESAETIRTPDEVIGLFSTKNERDNGQMKVYSVASRHNRSFNNFYMGCELGCGNFMSKPELNA